MFSDQLVLWVLFTAYHVCGVQLTDVTFNLSFLVPAILFLKIESAFINTIVMSETYLEVRITDS
jgi:hypothetical protein